MQTAIHNILALDVGEKRVGVAISNSEARLPKPLTTLNHDESLWPRLRELIEEENVKLIVVGLPRSLNGGETKQTEYVRSFAKTLANGTELPIQFQDEALTSVHATTELNKSKKPYAKSNVDALAATYILSDFLGEQVRDVK